ncbi:hypothetical protein Tco_0682214 [Tanacetum coccineum]|uniref:Uncharacterized protein n=1 Tax=Tanacetum coccineum TaxID=301880 RepID=A0ABQ4XQK5_9ASTR
MFSKSTSSGTPLCLLTPSSKVKFQHHERIIAYNNAVALLEHHDTLFKPMLSFLSNCSICTALTKEPSAMYVEYLKEFWYTTEVDDTTKDISFSLFLFENQLSFTRFDFLTTIGLTDSKTGVPLPPKGTVRAGLATLGLAKKDKPSLASTELSGTNVQPLSQPKAPTAKKSKKKKIPSSTQPKVSNDSREMNPPSMTTYLKATEELVVTSIPIQSLEASIMAEVPEKIIEKEEEAEEQPLKIPTVAQLLDEVIKKLLKKLQRALMT